MSIQHLHTASGSVFQVTTFKGGAIELDLVTSLSPIAAHGMARLTAEEARKLIGLLEHAVARTPEGWREV